MVRAWVHDHQNGTAAYMVTMMHSPQTIMLVRSSPILEVFAFHERIKNELAQGTTVLNLNIEILELTTDPEATQ